MYIYIKQKNYVQIFIYFLLETQEQYWEILEVHE
jgi:hypothetical protein